MSDTNMGKKVCNKGKSLSEEHKRKIGEALKGRKPWNKRETEFLGV